MDSMNAETLETLRGWIGRETTVEDVATRAPLAGLAALLDREAPFDVVPLLGHWLYFLPDVRQSEIGVDGHPLRGGFLPPVPLPRRMWAGGKFEFHAPIKVGAALSRRSVIEDVRWREGSSGDLVFVTVRHEVSADGAPAVMETQDIVYRPLAANQRPTKVESVANPVIAARTLTLDPVQLFRFSALTFNGHRIHYDRDYARDVESYAGLVVHGPLIAMLLLDLFQSHARRARVDTFAFRAVRPLFDQMPFDLCLAPQDGGATLWTRDQAGFQTMIATVGAS